MLLGLTLWLGFLLLLAMLMAAWLPGTQGASPTTAAALPSDRPSSEAAMRWHLQGAEEASGPAQAPDSSGPARDAATTMPLTDPAETALLQIFETLQQGQRQQALALSGRLTQAYPNFQLAQLLHAELLSEPLQQPLQDPDQTDLPGGSPAQARAQLQALHTEARRRLQHPPAQHLQGRLPKGLLALSPSQRYFAAVDASASRLYWFANATADDGQPRLKLMLSTYVSVGANGTGKVREGDARTPLGVYFIQQKLPGRQLPDLYGAGALTLNYPNAVDRMRGKTGSGIWLHGTPRAQHVRAPLASDGCVVLANADMQALLALPATTAVPVLIADRLEWVDEDSTQPPAAFSQALLDWLRLRHSGQLQALAAHYSARFEREDLGLDHWWPVLARQYRDPQRVQTLQLDSALAWHDEEDMIVATLSSTAEPARRGARGGQQLRTYWRLEQGHWKIVYEGPA